jgi:circadian clock protein KaiC
MERITTGIEPLDRILSGGFPANSIHIIMGDPGSGKTLLAEQIAFANGVEGRPALFLATVSEPLPKFITYLQESTFADSSRIGSSVIYENLGEVLVAGPQGLHRHLLELIQRHRPRIIVIDSFKAISDLMTSTTSWRQTLYEVAGVLTAYSATTFWVGEYSPDMAAHLPEFSVADGIIELSRRQQGSRDFRYVRVVKLRGSGFLSGLHALSISRAGLQVHPRLVTPVLSPGYRVSEQQLHSGIQGLDELIDTGLLRGTATLLAGPPGAGKTMLGLQFLREGLRTGEPSMLVSFEENPVQLARIARLFGMDQEALLGPRGLDLFYVSPVELQIDTIVSEIFRRISKNGVRRLVIDALGDLAATAEDPVRIRDYLYSMTQALAVLNVTSLLILGTGDVEVSGSVGLALADIAHLTDNVILLQMRIDEETERTVHILKTGGSAHHERRHKLLFTREGIRLA